VQQLVERHVEPPPRDEAAGHREELPEARAETSVESAEEVP
jgi:hypothetical protein